uniref:Uncharacterized protein n=1 Tax=Glossina austeni TaxID=7395 RepID=A0A1A9VCX2_GLOAU
MCHEMPLKLFCLLVAVVSLIENGFNYYLVEFTNKRANESKPCYYYDSESFRYLVHDKYFNFLTHNNPNQTTVTSNDFFFLPSIIVLLSKLYVLLFCKFLSDVSLVFGEA